MDVIKKIFDLNVYFRYNRQVIDNINGGNDHGCSITIQLMGS